MESIENITKKVAGLLKLAERAGSPEEAQAAAAKAAALMERYGIERDIALATSNEKEEAPELYDSGLSFGDETSRYAPQWKTSLAFALAKLHGCVSYTSREFVRDENGKRVRDKDWRYMTKATQALVGRPSDVATVRYLFAYVVDQCNRLTEEYGKGRGKSWCTDFRLGLVVGVVDAIKKAQVQQQELVVQEAQSTIDPERSLTVIKTALQKREQRIEEAEEALAAHGITLRNARRAARDIDFGAAQAGRDASARINIKSEAKGALGSGRKAIKG